jgi:5-(carboxyamino)imidazole ribonucleotide mutase
MGGESSPNGSCRRVVIIAGSRSDEPHVDKIIKGLNEELGPEADCIAVYASAHREPLRVLQAIEDNKGAVFITVAGRSNALSGVVAANCNDVVIACPPFSDTAAYSVDIHSTLRMPSGVPVLAIIDPLNCAKAVARIIKR